MLIYRWIHDSSRHDYITASCHLVQAVQLQDTLQKARSCNEGSLTCWPKLSTQNLCLAHLARHSTNSSTLHRLCQNKSKLVYFFFRKLHVTVVIRGHQMLTTNVTLFRSLSLWAKFFQLFDSSSWLDGDEIGRWGIFTQRFLCHTIPVLWAQTCGTLSKRSWWYHDTFDIWLTIDFVKLIQSLKPSCIFSPLSANTNSWHQSCPFPYQLSDLSKSWPMWQKVEIVLDVSKRWSPKKSKVHESSFFSFLFYKIALKELRSFQHFLQVGCSPRLGVSGASFELVPLEIVEPWSRSGRILCTPWSEIKNSKRLQNCIQFACSLRIFPSFCLFFRCFLRNCHCWKLNTLAQTLPSHGRSRMWPPHLKLGFSSL